MTKETRCEGCKWLGVYFYPAVGNSPINDKYCCDYCYRTGNVRGIPVSECYKHEGTPYREGPNQRRIDLTLNRQKR